MAFNPFRPGPAASTPANWGANVAPDTPLPVGGWSADRAIIQGLEICSWVYACINIRGKGVSSVPWVIEKRKGRAFDSMTWERFAGDGREDLLESPNPFMPRKFLMHLQSIYLDVCGNALFKMLRVDGGKRVKELWPIYPVGTHVIRGGVGGWIRGYTVQEEVGPQDIEADDVIHAMNPNPRTPWWGFGPLQVLAGTVDTDTAMARAARKLATNNNMPPAVISDPTIKTPQALIQGQDALDARWSRDQRGKPLLLPAGAQLVKLALTPAETAYIESRKWSVAEISAPFDILPGVFDPAQVSDKSLAASLEFMWEQGIIPQLDVLREYLNLRLLTPDERRTIYITYDLSNVKALKVQLTRTVADFRSLVTTGVPAHIANKRLELGLPRYPGDDVSTPLRSPTQGFSGPTGGHASGGTVGNTRSAGGEIQQADMTAPADPRALGASSSPSTSTPNQSGD